VKWRVERSRSNPGKWRLVTGNGDFIDKDGDGLKALAQLHNSQLAKARRRFTKARKR